MTSIPERLTHALGDRYRIDGELGSGGMAVVYRAHDLKHDRPVALKVLKPELTDLGQESERFLREIRVVARLTHPHVLPLHDSGAREGVLFFVMPLVGESLRERLTRAGRLPVTEAVRIACAVADALGYAHARGVLHRDVKPENILFVADHPLVTDFGVARAMGRAADVVTERGVAVGTPAYMSPEQASGEDALDARSDVYSLACVLYEMLTGEPPFTGSARQVMLRHATVPPPPILEHRPDVPPAVAAALERGLAKDPDARFPSAEALAEALRAPAARAGGTTARRIAVLPFVNATGDPQGDYLCEGLADELMTALRKVDGLDLVSRSAVFAPRHRAEDARVAGARLQAAAVVDGTVRRAGDRLRVGVRLTEVATGELLWSERYDCRLEDVFTLEDDIGRAVVVTLRRTLLRDIGDLHPKRYTENAEAYRLYLAGRYYWNRRQPADLERAIALFTRALEHDPAYALAYTGLADCYAIQLDYRSIPVAEGLEKARAAAQRALDLDEALAEPHTSLGWVTFIYGWDWPGAEREFRRAIELEPRYATAHQWYAWLLMALGRFNEALAEGHVALDLDPASVSIRRSLGWLYYHAGMPAEGVTHARRALAMDPTSDETHRILGLVELSRGDTAAAETAMREAVRLSDGAAVSVGALALALGRAGQRDAALRLREDLRARTTREYVSPVALGLADLGVEDYEGVLDALERAHRERRGWVVYLNVEPLFDPVRAHPRFQALRREMGLA